MNHNNHSGTGERPARPGNTHSWIWLVTTVVVLSAISNVIGG